MEYIQKVDERDLYGDGVGRVSLWDLSRANENEESRIEAISTIASVCYSKPPKNAKKLVERLWTESGGEMSSAFEFIRGCDCEECDDIGIDSSLRNFINLPTDEEWAERRRYEVGEVSGWHRRAVATFKIKVPIFIRSQIVRHRSFAVQEISRRYTTDKQAPIEVWVPPHSKSHPEARAVFMDSCAMSYAAYKDLLDLGIRSEVARGVLPQSLYTELWVQGNVPAWKNYFVLRLDQHAQKEHREVAQAMLDLLKEHQPELWEKVKP